MHFTVNGSNANKSSGWIILDPSIAFFHVELLIEVGEVFPEEADPGQNGGFWRSEEGVKHFRYLLVFRGSQRVGWCRGGNRYSWIMPDTKYLTYSRIIH